MSKSLKKILKLPRKVRRFYKKVNPDRKTLYIMSEEGRKFFNRDLSWLSFNYRVLEEAKDKTLPLYERIKFLAIYSSNLDEFYKVRVASYRSHIDLIAESNEVNPNKKYRPEQILKRINSEVSRQLEEFHCIFENSILKELEANNIIFHKDETLTDPQKDFIHDYFYHEVLPYIQPALLAEGKVFTFLQDSSIYLAVKLYKKEEAKTSKKDTDPNYAIIKIPSNELPRFVEMPKVDDKYHIILLDDIIKYHLKYLFPGYRIDSYYSIKLTRDADLLIEDEFHGDLIEKIRRSLIRRKTGRPSRFQYDRRIPDDFLNILIDVFNLSEEDLVPSGSYLNRSDFFNFPNPLSPKLELDPLPPMSHPELDAYDSMFEAIKDRDWILHFPYQTYDYIVDFFNQAAFDPKVKEIKTTQYRAASNSAIVNALISAARNGKKVTVFVEVKARFDEENNLRFADKMRQAGVKVISSIPGLKVHAKVGLVLRKSRRQKQQRGYAYLSTGNFNEKTAKLYCDEGLFTSNDNIIDELSNLFLHLENQNLKFEFKHILVAQFNMLDEFLLMIEREIEHAKQGKKAHMILKMNGLEEKKVINKLYDASLAGVKVDLIVRGICCLVPNQKYSQNIRLTRIVDRFLEHARIFVFYNDGNNDIYISSADWMNRNLHRRIESGIPIYDERIKEEIIDMLNIQIKDNVSARYINAKLQNVKIKPRFGEKKVRAQIDTYKYLKDKWYKPENKG